MYIYIYIIAHYKHVASAKMTPFRLQYRCAPQTLLTSVWSHVKSTDFPAIYSQCIVMASILPTMVTTDSFNHTVVRSPTGIDCIKYMCDSIDCTWTSSSFIIQARPNGSLAKWGWSNNCNRCNGRKSRKSDNWKECVDDSVDDHFRGNRVCRVDAILGTHLLGPHLSRFIKGGCSGNRV